MSHSRQPLVKGERLVRYEVNTVITRGIFGVLSSISHAYLHPCCSVALVHGMDKSGYATKCVGGGEARGISMATCKWIITGFFIFELRCSPRGCAAPGKVPCQGNTQGCLSKLKATPSLRKIVVTCKSPVGDISAVTLIRTDTTLDHSQKAEKVCPLGEKALTVQNVISMECRR